VATWGCQKIKVKFIPAPSIAEWWATKTRYPPYTLGLMGNKNPLPTLHFRIGGQQKPVTHPTTDN